MLENSVSKYPDETGRFLQCSGVEFPFDPRKEPGNRVDPRLVKIGNTYLDYNIDYCVAINDYVTKGKDGYTMLLNATNIVSFNFQRS